MLDCPITLDRDDDARLGINVVSSAASTLLKQERKLREVPDTCETGRVFATNSSRLQVRSFAGEAFLRIPPFPGARAQQFARDARSSLVDPEALADKLRQLRVGGTFWAAQPVLPKAYVLVRSMNALPAAANLGTGHPIVLWSSTEQSNDLTGVTQVSGECDPWHMLGGASAVITEKDDELKLIASLTGVPCYDFCAVHGIVAPTILEPAHALERLCATPFENPFTGEPMDALEAAELCGFWRRLIDSNRELVGGVGFAFWKQSHVATLLWGGSERFRFVRGAGEIRSGAPVAVWRAKSSPAVVAELERQMSVLIEVEDGFLRSRGLGADCIPPLSITVDRLGAYFDPSKPSELEMLLEQGGFDEALIERARKLRHLIVEAGIGKYERGTDVLDRPAGDRRHILVPGQVEDDRAVETGGCGLVANLDLLARVREQARDAFILYKPHPDVLAGHRRGAVSENACLRYADQIVGDLPIASLIAMVDEVHVNTSLTGFEALLRDKPVTTYGVPFYAGWGLTNDLGPVPLRRTAKRTIDELVAATLLLYPRYLDPVTGLPCPAEIIVDRLSVCERVDEGLIVSMRRLQGKLLRRLRRLVQ